MALIFGFSAQTAAESSELSEGLVTVMLRTLMAQFRVLSPEAQEAWVQGLQFIVRKSAHAAAYAVLAMLWLGTARTFAWRHPFLTAWGLTTVYAVTDELHQLLVPGRSGELRDVLIDSTGALVGLLAVWAVLSLVHRLRHKKFIR